MSAHAIERARSPAWDMPLDKINVSQPELFRTNTFWPYFERLRREDPVHYCAESEYGPYWSVTKYNDIMAVDTNHQVFSSEATLGGITIRNQQADFMLPMFIAMDPPKHDAQRKVVSPIVAPDNLDGLEPHDPRARRRRSSTNCRSARPSTGWTGLDRAHHPDAGDAVRLPVRGAAQADALVRRRDRRAGPRHRRHAKSSAAPS